VRSGSVDNIKKGNNAFYIGENIEDALAVITFVPAGDSEIIIDHTYVSFSLRGKGIALELLKKVVEYARNENKKIIPACSYARKVLTQDKEFEDVLK
jgi:uncharacterized protein